MIDASELGVRHGLAASEALLAREARHLAEIMKIRFYPFALAEADGCYLRDADGNVYLDLVASGAVMGVGSGNAHVREAIERALAGPWSTTSAIFAHEDQAVLAERLSDLLGGERKVWFGNSGSEAMDALARSFRAASGRERLVAFTGAFHGVTGGSGAISGMDSHSDLASDRVDKVDYPYPYRCPHGPCPADGCSLRCVESLAGALERGRGATAGVILEAIQSDGGDVIPPDNALARIGELCREHGVWLGVDEIKVGMGRTGRMFAYEHAGLDPDAVGLGKSLGGGLALSAIVARPEILDYAAGTCAYTLGGSPAPCAAALAALDELEQHGLVDNARLVGAQLLDGLQAAIGSSRIVGEVRGRGLVLGIELVEDQESRVPAPRHAARIAYRLFELGAVAIVMGRFSNVIEITPPLTLTARQAEAAVELVEEAVGDVAAGRFDDAKLAAYPGW